LTACYQLLSQSEIQPEKQPDGPEPLQWETRNKNFHEALIAAYESPWTKYMLAILYRHGERYRNINWRLAAAHAIERQVHEEHEAIYHAAINRQDARAALALESHIRLTHDIVKQQSWIA
jgi:DNA-binding GntR family transcriptional regulator